MKNIIVKEKVINITGSGDHDYISLTDIAKCFGSRRKWIIILEITFCY